MFGIDFHAFSVWVNLAIFTMCAVVVWFAGVRAERYVEGISQRLGWRQAFGGLILLAGSTSLPELATSVSGALIDNAPLVVSNLTGGVAMQTAILVIADATFAQGPITNFTPRFVFLLQGVSLIILLAIAIMGIALVGVASFWGVGLDSTVIFGAYLVLVFLIYRYSDRPRWLPAGDERELPEPERQEGLVPQNGADQGLKLSRLWWLYAGVSAVILIAGWGVTMSADALSNQVGISASFVGAAFVAIATSLPEISTTTTAVKNGNNETAFGNIFGSNLFDIALLFVADLVFRQGPILAHSGDGPIFMAALSILMTCVYLFGILEWKEKKVWRIGIDSAIVAVLYVAGLLALYATAGNPAEDELESATSDRRSGEGAPFP